MLLEKATLMYLKNTVWTWIKDLDSFILGYYAAGFVLVSTLIATVAVFWNKDAFRSSRRTIESSQSNEIAGASSPAENFHGHTSKSSGSSAKAKTGMDVTQQPVQNYITADDIHPDKLLENSQVTQHASSSGIYGRIVASTTSAVKTATSTFLPHDIMHVLHGRKSCDSMLSARESFTDCVGCVNIAHHHGQEKEILNVSEYSEFCLNRSGIDSDKVEDKESQEENASPETHNEMMSDKESKRLASSAKLMNQYNKRVQQSIETPFAEDSDYSVSSKEILSSQLTLQQRLNSTDDSFTTSPGSFQSVYTSPNLGSQTSETISGENGSKRYFDEFDASASQSTFTSPEGWREALELQIASYSNIESKTQEKKEKGHFVVNNNLSEIRQNDSNIGQVRNTGRAIDVTFHQPTTIRTEEEKQIMNKISKILNEIVDVVDLADRSVASLPEE